MRERADILYRPFEPGDFEAVAELMRAQWSCDLEGAVGEYSASIDLCGYLADADWGLVAEGRGQVLGAVLLRTDDEPDPKWAARRDMLMAEAAADLSLEEEIHRDVDILEEEALLSDEYAQSDGIGNGAEIKLLIVSPAAQGLGVGGRLFGEAKRRAAELGGFYLLTDDSCDVGFYEHKGMRRMAKRASAVEAPACPQTADADDDGDFNLYVYAQGL